MPEASGMACEAFDAREDNQKDVERPQHEFAKSEALRRPHRVQMRRASDQESEKS